MKPLEQVLADWSERVSAARFLKHEREAELLDQLVAEVRESAHEYITWISEAEAALRSGHQTPWFRHRFAEWERAGHARRGKSGREYRMLIVPRRANLAAAREAGRRAARDAA